ncbi:MAG: hypothetical protein JXX14_18920, partial [Deltaproteobacteria bacterium]|nr:hypothetical protein [Deltaproteobacteria bacterium]
MRWNNACAVGAMRTYAVAIMIGVILFFLTTCPCIHAADTVEPFGLGATDFELYTGVEGMGMGKYDRCVFGDIVLGYGILNRLSGYVGTTLAANGHWAGGSQVFAIGVYGNVLDTPHVDVDLFWSISLGAGEFAVTPALELNLDSDAEMRGFGAY